MLNTTKRKIFLTTTPLAMHVSISCNKSFAATSSVSGEMTFAVKKGISGDMWSIFSEETSVSYYRRQVAPKSFSGEKSMF